MCQGLAELGALASPPHDETLHEQLRLLQALSRSPASCSVTGKDQSYWKRRENVCLRLCAVRGSARGGSGDERKWLQWRDRHDALVASLEPEKRPRANGAAATLTATGGCFASGPAWPL